MDAGGIQFSRLGPSALGTILISISCLPGFGQGPIPLRSSCKLGPDKTLYLQELRWSIGDAPWRAEFRWTFPNPAQPPESEPSVQSLAILGPDGGSQVFTQDLGLLACMYGGPDDGAGEKPLYDYLGPNPIFPAETISAPDWRVTRVTWAQVAGGNPPIPFLIVAEHLPSKRWIAQLMVGWNMPQPDRGSPIRISFPDSNQVRIEWWDRAGRRLSQLRSKSILWDGKQLSSISHPNRYSLYTRTGAVSTLGDTAQEAIHAGFQEVSWFIEAQAGTGGLARAFANSPRTLVDFDDRIGAPLLPTRGAQVHFVWSKDVYLVPWGQSARRVTYPEASKLAKSGGWEVVLFPRKGAPALATRLIQRHIDFDHSRPPKP